MALRWIEGFELMGLSGSFPTSFISVKYPEYSFAAAPNINSIVRGSGGLSLAISSSVNTNYFGTPQFTAAQTWIIGWAFRYATGIPTANMKLLELIDVAGGGGVHGSVYLKTDGKLEVRNGSGAVLGTSALTTTFDTWYFVELKYKVDDSTGTVQLKVNQSDFINLTGQDTRNGGNATADRVRWYMGFTNNSGRASYVDDLYVCDDTGADCNDFLGDLQVESLVPGSAGTNTGWVPSSGSNWAAVDDNPPDDDSTYVQANSLTAKDTYNLLNLSRLNSGIRGIMWNARARLTDSQTFNVKPVYRVQGGPDVDGSTIIVSNTAYREYYEVQSLSTGTGTFWTPTEINSLEVGAKLA
jgi:hypothetical protein